MTLILIFLVILVPLLGSTVSFLFVFTRKDRLFNDLIFVAFELFIFGLAGTMFLFDSIGKLDCCQSYAINETYAIPVYILYYGGLAAYFILTYHRKKLPPIPELLLRALLFAFLSLLVIFILQFWNKGEFEFILMGITPGILLVLQTMYLRDLIYSDDSTLSRLFFPFSNLGYFGRFVGQIPLLAIVFTPIAFALNALLLLFGQKPDAIILAFTQTYHHHFSELTSQCDNVFCGGHYLCSVAANGNQKMVGSYRLGLRAGKLIICNRQLLASNAFENILEERFPSFHKWVRKQYDKLGDHIHRDYSIYQNKWVSNTVYLLMKPAEWLFIFILYCTDVNPENRIALQYTHIPKNQYDKYL